MIKINKDTIDLVLQVEEDTLPINLINKLSLDTGDVLVICPDLFFQRFIQYVHDTLEAHAFDMIESQLLKTNGYVYLEFIYKRKVFFFHFLITSSKTKVVNNPFKGEQVFKIGIKEITV